MVDEWDSKFFVLFWHDSILQRFEECECYCNIYVFVIIDSMVDAQKNVGGD
jgi:hypothetical protein